MASYFLLRYNASITMNAIHTTQRPSLFRVFKRYVGLATIRNTPTEKETEYEVHFMNALQELFYICII
jgi:hypothetical protein